MAGFIAILLLAGTLLLHTNTVRQRIKDLLVGAVERQYGVRLELGDLSGTLFSGLAVHQVRLSDQRGLLFSADRISIRYVLPLLLRRTLMIRHLGLDGPHLFLAREKNGRWNVSDLVGRMQEPSSAEPAREALRVILHRLSLKAGRLTIRDATTQPPKIRQVDNIRLDIRLDSGPPMTAELRRVAFLLDTPRFELIEGGGRVRFDPETGRLGIKGLRLRTPASSLAVDADYDTTLSEPQINLALVLDKLSLEEIGRLTSVTYLDRGEVRGTIKLKGSLQRLAHQLDIRLDGQSIAAKGVLTRDSDNTLALETSGQLRDLDPAAWPIDGGLQWQGDVDADFEVTGRHLSQDDRQIRLKLKVAESRLAGHRIDSGSLDLGIQNGELSIGNILFNGSPGTVQFEGRITGMGEGPLFKAVSLTGTVHDFDPSAFLSDPTWQGRLNAALRLEADGKVAVPDVSKISDWNARVEIRLQPSFLMGTTIAKADVNADWDGKILQVKNFALQTELGNAALTGRATAEPFDYSVGGQISVTEIKKLGRLVTRLAPQIPTDQLPGGGLQLNGHWDGKILQVKTLALQTELGNATLDGRLVLRPFGYRIGGQIMVPNLQRIGPLLTSLLPDVQAGRLPQGSYQIKGTVDGNPTRTAIDAVLQAEKVVRDGLVIESARLTGVGQITADAISGRITGRFRNIDFQDRQFPRLETAITVSPTILTADIDLNHSGGERLQLAGEVENWTQNQRRVRIDRLLLSGLPAPIGSLAPEISNSSPIQLQIQGDRLDIESLTLTGGEATLRASGRLDLNGAQNLQIALSNVDLDGLADLWPDQTPFKGRLSADAEMTGPAEAPRIEARLNVEGAAGYNVALSRLALQLRYGDKLARLTATGYRGDRQLFSFEGHTGLRLDLATFETALQPDSLAAHLTAPDLKLSDLPLPKFRELALDGLADIDLRASGNLLKPILTGTLALKNGSLALPRQGLTYPFVQIELRLLPGRLVVEKLLLRDNQAGTLNGTGTVQLDGLTPSVFDLQVGGKNASVSWNRTVSARVNPDLSLTGSLSAPVISGKLRIPESRINLDRLAAGAPAEIEILDDQALSGRQIVITDRTKDQSGILSRSAVDVIADIPRNAWLKGQDLNAEIAGSITLKKPPGGTFILTGTLNTVRGDYEFRGRRFKITSGQVDFIGQKDPNPLLDIRAESRFRDVVIIVHITGSARKIELSLESEPSMEQSDIISYIVFGRPTEELRWQQASGTESAALSLTGKVAAEELNKILGDTLSLDAFNIEPGEEDWRAGSLSLGKYVTRNIFVAYRYGFTSQSFGQVEIDYQINKNFSLQTQVGDELTTGVDLIWQFDF